MTGAIGMTAMMAGVTIVVNTAATVATTVVTAATRPAWGSGFPGPIHSRIPGKLARLGNWPGRLFVMYDKRDFSGEIADAAMVGQRPA